MNMNHIFSHYNIVSLGSHYFSLHTHIYGYIYSLHTYCSHTTKYIFINLNSTVTDQVKLQLYNGFHMKKKTLSLSQYFIALIYIYLQTLLLYTSFCTSILWCHTTSIFICVSKTTFSCKKKQGRILPVQTHQNTDHALKQIVIKISCKSKEIFIAINLM